MDKSEPIVISGIDKKNTLKQRVMELLPDGGNLNQCLTCGSCTSGCPASGLADMDPRKFLRMAVLGMEAEIAESPWIWFCTLCMRCKHACPMNINIPQLVFYGRQQVPREKRPRGIRESCDLALKHDTCSAMGASEEDFRFVVEDVLEEVRNEQPGFKELQAPIDKEGAAFFINQNSREPVTEPEEMVPLWKLLHRAGVDWTYGSKGWAAENYCMFIADEENWKHIVATKAKAVDDLQCKVWLNTEWGHELFAVRAGLQRFNIPHNFEVDSIFYLYADWIREGKLKVSSDWNKDLKVKFTLHDPCQIVRKSFGDHVADEMRYVAKALVGEENFIEMHPNRSNNYCCGGGGGSLQSGFMEKRRAYGQLKLEQILDTGADYCIAPCHNCHSQIHDLAKFSRAKFHTVHFWTLFGLALGCLGKDERLYLGPDLAQVGLLKEEA